MGLFTKDEEAKARRTQEREEQQKKAKAVPPPYVHTPTHALNDALLSVPHAYKGTDKQRLKQAHQQRLEKEASALAAGSDTNVTNIPAKYWQGQPLPAQFKAPTPAKLRKLALSSPSLKGKKVKLPAASAAKQQPQAPTDEGKSNLSTHNMQHLSFTLKQDMHLATTETARVRLLVSRLTRPRAHFRSPRRSNLSKIKLPKQAEKPSWSASGGG